MTSVNIQDAFPKGRPSQRLSKEFIGSWVMFDPLATNVSDLYVRPLGQLLSRNEYPEFWEWVQASRDDLLDDTSWLAVQTASPNGAVSNYSSGDGSTTFRVPSTGNTADGSGVFFRDKGNITDPVLLNVGKQDQIVNIEGQFFFHNSSDPSIINADSITGALHAGFINEGVYKNTSSLPLVTFSTAKSTAQVLFDASRQVNTGDQVQPNNMLMSYYIYTGKGTASYSPLPDIYDFMNSMSNRNIWLNSDLTINQRGKTINEVAHGEYFADRWRKVTDNTKMRQPVDERNYTPNAVHTISYSDGTVRQVTSPTSGDWDNADLDVPVGMSWYKLEEGGFATKWRKTNDVEELLAYYQILINTIYCWPLANSKGVQGINVGIAVTYVKRMRKNPQATPVFVNCTIASSENAHACQYSALLTATDANLSARMESLTLEAEIYDGV